MANKEKNQGEVDFEEYEELEKVFQQISKLPEPYLSAAITGNVEFFQELELPNLEKKLHEKFPLKDIEWVIVHAYDYEIGGKHMIKAFAQPYIKKESAERRADIVFGAMNWRNDFNMPDGTGRFKYKLEFRKDPADLADGEENEWIPKLEGGSVDQNARGGFADKNFEVALSFAEKRAWAKAGIGRYLKLVPQIEVRLSTDWVEGWNYYSIKSKVKGTKENPHYIKIYWQEPQLPKWALNEDEKDIYNQSQDKPNAAPPPEEPSPANSDQWEIMIAYYDNMPEKEKGEWHNFLFADEVDDESGEVTGSARRNLSEPMAKKIIASLEKGYGPLNENNIPKAFVGPAEQGPEQVAKDTGNPADEEVKNLREAANEKK